MTDSFLNWKSFNSSVAKTALLFKGSTFLKWDHHILLQKESREGDMKAMISLHKDIMNHQTEGIQETQVTMELN